MKATFIFIFFLTVSAAALGQNTFPSSGNAGVGTTSPPEPFFVNGNVGVLHSGTYLDAWGRWMNIGNVNYSSYPLYLGSNKYGVGMVWDSDGVFFGLSDEGSNRKDAIIAWGDDSQDNLRFLMDNGEVARISATGLLGLGTTAPETKIHILDGAVSGTQALNGSTKLTVDAAGGGFAEFRTTSDNNTWSGTLFTDNNLGGYVAFRNYPDDKLHIGAYGAIAFEVGTDNSVGGKSEKMRILSDGNVGIGISSPAEKLAVNGKIRSKEIKVEITGWPDYVFAEGYNRMSLGQLATYIGANKRLPGMPSASEVEANGVELGAMNKKLLEKIEELTLYLIEKDKQLATQDQRLAELERKFEALSAKLPK